jgi:hypothetical protein
MFNDITTLLLRPGVFKDAVDLFVERYRGMRIDAVAGNNQQNPTDTSPRPSSRPSPSLPTGDYSFSLSLSLSLSGGPCLKRHVAVLALRFRKISGADLPWSFCSPALLSPRAPAPRHLPCGRVRPPSAARTTPFLALLARSLTPVASRACFPREDHIIIAPLILPRYCGWICVAASAAAISIRQVQS